jgi:hypothetical protein
MAGSSKKMRVSENVLLHELLQKNNYSDISGSEYSSDSEINMAISSCGEQSVSSDDGENVSDTAYGQSMVLSDYVFHLLASLA